MAFISSSTLLYARVCFLLTVAFYLVKDPQTIIGANFTIILGQAMQLTLVKTDDYNPLLGVCSMGFVMSALNDLIPLFENNLDYFYSIVPIRCGLYFVLAAYSYLGDSYYLSNNLVFSYGFIEVWLNFLIFNNLRDERYNNAKKQYLDTVDDEVDFDVEDENVMTHVMEDIVEQVNEM